MSYSKTSVILPFSQNYETATTPTGKTLGGTIGSTGHIRSWRYVGLDENVWLYNYDASNNSNTWYLNLLNGSVENNPADGTSPNLTLTLKYLANANEIYNLSNFYCERIKVSLHHELSKYYSLENLYVTSQLSTNKYDKRLVLNEQNENSYYFDVNSAISIPTSAAIDNSFIFTLKYKEILNSDITEIAVRHDPRFTELFVVTVEGYNLNYNLLELGTGTIDYREYSKRIYIRGSSEHGYLRFDRINERFEYVSPTPGNTGYTMFEFNITDSVLYNILVKGSDDGNDVTVPMLKIKGGKFVASIKNSELISSDESVIVEYCELYLYDSEVQKVPYKSNILRIEKSRTGVIYPFS